MQQAHPMDEDQPPPVSSSSSGQSAPVPLNSASATQSASEEYMTSEVGVQRTDSEALVIKTTYDEANKKADKLLQDKDVFMKAQDLAVEENPDFHKLNLVTKNTLIRLKVPEAVIALEEQKKKEAEQKRLQEETICRQLEQDRKTKAEEDKVTLVNAILIELRNQSTANLSNELLGEMLNLLCAEITEKQFEAFCAKARERTKMFDDKYVIANSVIAPLQFSLLHYKIETLQKQINLLKNLCQPPLPSSTSSRPSSPMCPDSPSGYERGENLHAGSIDPRLNQTLGAVNPQQGYPISDIRGYVARASVPHTTSSTSNPPVPPPSMPPPATTSAEGDDIDIITSSSSCRGDNNDDQALLTEISNMLHKAKKRKRRPLNPVQYARNKRRSKDRNHHVSSHANPDPVTEPRRSPSPETGAETTIQESDEIDPYDGLKTVFDKIKAKAMVKIVDAKKMPMITEKEWSNFEQAFLNNTDPDYDRPLYLCWHKDLPKKKQNKNDPVMNAVFTSSSTGKKAPRQYFHYCIIKGKGRERNATISERLLSFQDDVWSYYDHH